MKPTQLPTLLKEQPLIRQESQAILSTEPSWPHMLDQLVRGGTLPMLGPIEVAVDFWSCQWQKLKQ